MSSGDTAEIYCPKCGYDLRGTAGEQVRCPECGSAYERGRLSESRVPWMQRATIGRWSAWWRTCWMALFRPSDFAASLMAPLPYADARRFWIMTLAVYLPLLLVWVALLHEPPTVSSGWAGIPSTPASTWEAVLESFTTPWLVGAEWLWAVLLAVGLAVVLATGGVSYLFQVAPLDRRRQDRAAAVGLYTSGAVVAGFLCAAALGAILTALLNTIHPASYADIGGVAFLMVVLALLLWWLAVLNAYRRVARAGAGRTLVAALAIVLITVLSLVIGLGGVPFVVGMIRVFIAFAE